MLYPILFNAYTNNITSTILRKFIYADDVALVALATFTDLDQTLNVDIIIIQEYFGKRQLKLNSNKSVTNVFHLNNWEGNIELDIRFDRE